METNLYISIYWFTYTYMCMDLTSRSHKTQNMFMQTICFHNIPETSIHYAVSFNSIKPPSKQPCVWFWYYIVQSNTSHCYTRMYNKK